MSNVLTFKKAQPSMQMRDRDMLKHLKEVLTMVAIPYPKKADLRWFLEYICDDGVEKEINRRLEIMKGMLEAEYETKH